MNLNAPFSRRIFLTRSAQGTAAISLTRHSLLAKNALQTFAVEASDVRGIAVDSMDQVFIAADSNLLVYSLEGNPMQQSPAPAPLHAITIAPDGRVFTATRDQIFVLKPDSTLEAVGASLGDASQIADLVVSDAGDIYASDGALRLVWRLSATGEVLGQIKPSEKGFAVPKAHFPITWQNGHLIVAEPGRHQVQRYTPEGQLVSRWGSRSRTAEGFSGCCNPVSLTPLPDGTLATAERGLPRIKIFRSEGQLKRLIAGPETFIDGARDGNRPQKDLESCGGGALSIAASSSGKIVVLDQTTREVLVLA